MENHASTIHCVTLPNYFYKSIAINKVIIYSQEPYTGKAPIFYCK